MGGLLSLEKPMYQQIMIAVMFYPISRTVERNWKMIDVACKRFLAWVAFGGILCAGSGWANTVLDFQDIPIPGNTESAPFFTYSNNGFTLTATNPSTGFLSGFQAHGANSTFFAGAIGVTPFAPSSAPDNLIQLRQNNGDPFSMLSIDLARNFAFDPAPTVTFVGTRMGGGIVTETFTVTTPVGLSAFQTFTFSGFTDLEAVTWGQPVLSDGLHQFTGINLAPTPAPIPEPHTWLLLAGALIGLVGQSSAAQKLMHR